MGCWFSQFFVYFKKTNAESNAKYFKIISLFYHYEVKTG